MGTFHVFGCDACGKSVELGGPQEFRRGLFGKLKEVRHAGAGRKKIDGLWIFLWCPTCRTTGRKILLEFAEPSDPIRVWGRTAPIKPEYRAENPDRFRCDKCSTLMVDEIEEGPCPWCGKGTVGYRTTIQT